MKAISTDSATPMADQLLTAAMVHVFALAGFARLMA